MKRLCPILLIVIVLSACRSDDVTRSFVSLKGQWDYRNGFDTVWLADGRSAGWQSVQIPGNISEMPEFGDYTGFITLRKKLPPEVNRLFVEGKNLAFRSGNVNCETVQFYLNAKLIGTMGSNIPYWRVIERELIENLPYHAFIPKSTNAIYAVVKKAADSRETSFKGPEIKIGESKSIFHAFYKSVILASVLIAYYLATGLYHFYLGIKRTKDLHNLYFGLFIVTCTFFQLANTAVSELVFGGNAPLLNKVDQISLKLLGPFFILFIYYFFFRKHSKITIWVTAYCLVLATIDLFGSVHGYKYQLQIWYPAILVCVVFSLYVISKEAVKRKPEAILLLAGMFLLTFGVVYDILVTENVLQRPFVFPYTVFFMVVGISVVLANRFVRVHNELEDLNVSLEQKVEERTKELEETQQELIEKAHKAGMADVASGALHNVGNILNSIRTSAGVIGTVMVNSSLTGLKKANSLLRENILSLEEFIASDPKGKKLMEYYLKLEEFFDKENEEVRNNLERLNNKIDMITEVITAQQNYAGVGSLTEKHFLSKIVDDALMMQIGSIERYGVSVVKDYCELPKIDIQKNKLIHVLINLINNAKDAMLQVPLSKRKIEISTKREKDLAFLTISDAGIGIPQEDVKKIFTHGFTTKAGGHGFGLHSCAIYMAEMNGRISVKSKGINKGTSFILEFQL